MYAGIDIGTGSLKAVIGLENGSTEVISQKYETEMFSPGIHSGRYFHRSFKMLMEKISGLSARLNDKLKGIGFCGHGPSIILVAADGTFLTDIITWQDNSAVAAAEELKKSITGFEKDGTCFEAKLLKLFNESPSLFQEGVKALYPKDLAVFLLTGNFTLDYSTASTLAFYKKDTRTLSAGTSGIPGTVFPELREPWETAGVTSGSFARDCGLESGIPVISGGIDAWCEALGAGAFNEGMMVDGTGTSTCITKCREDDESNLEHVVPGRTLDIETMSSTGESVAWVSRLTGISLEEIRNLETGKPLPLIFLPYLNGERSPVWDEKASASFIGLDSGITDTDLVRGVLQGIAFGTRQCIELVADDGNRTEKIIRAVGGGANNRAVLQYKADITGYEFHSMKETDAAPLGAMILAAYAGGEGSIKELTDRWVKINFRIEPSGLYPEIWEDMYRIYSDAYPGIRETVHRLSAVKTKSKETT